jgi:hypothetical protein
MFDLSKATITECKAVAYDILANIEALQKDLQTISKAIAQKSEKQEVEQAKPVKTEEVKEAKK